MANKRVRISPDGGATFYTLPGNTAELTREAGDLDDTIFGQDYKSGQTGLISWMINANGLYKGFAGYVAKVKKSGTPTNFTAEAATLVSGKTYKITDATKNAWNRLVTPTVLVSATPVAANNIESYDFLNGKITFISSYTPAGPVTLTGSYLPLTQIAKANSFTLTQTTDAIDNSDFETTQANGGYRTFEAGLKTVRLSVTGTYAPSNAFEALLEARGECIIEIGPDGANKSVARGWFKPMSTNQSGDVGDLEEQTLEFTLSVPDQENVLLPFNWTHDSTSTLSRAVKEAIIAWETGEETYVDYLSDGSAGYEGAAIVTDVSLSGGLEAMNEFSIKFQGTDAPQITP